MAFRLDEQIAAAFKSLFGIAHTGMSNREWYAELFGRKPPIYGSEAWRELTYGTDFYANHTTALPRLMPTLDRHALGMGQAGVL